jgi:hypothetical protein
MRKLFLGVTLAAAAAAAHAGIVAQATVTCGGNPAGYYNSGGVPTLNVTYSPAADAGNPGLFWFGLLTPDQQFANALDITGNWVQYLGGLYPPHKRFDAGLPGTITVSVPFPADQYGSAPTNTSQFVGYTIYAGHGIYTQQAAQMVNDRRTYLNSVKAERQAKGTWKAAYEDDTQFMWSLVQKDMTDKTKWGAVITVPYIDCAPQDSGGGG